MRKGVASGLVLVVLLGGWLVLSAPNQTEAGKAQGQLLSHEV